MIRVRITAHAGEKLSPAQWESLERSVSVTIERELLEETDSVGLDKLVADVTQAAQMRAEAQLYASLSRAMSSRGQPTAWLRTAALDRSKRIDPEPVENQTHSTTTPDSGVLN